MSQDQPAEPVDAGVDGPDNTSGNTAGVLQWGEDDTDRPRGHLARTLAGLRADPRLAPLIAGIAGLAFLASMLTEWRVWRIASIDVEGGEEGALENPILSGVEAFPSIGTAYLVGVLLLAACVTLALAGAGPVRHNARLVGTATAGVVLGILVTATVRLDQLAGLLDDIAMSPGEMRTEVVAGRGLYLAYAGVLATALALLLAPGPRPEPDTATAARADGDRPDGDRAWRPRPGGMPARPFDGPEDLTVEPASPFLPPGDTDGRR